jgi:predicted enzyme related to lactoylglutathione lyase
MNRVIHFEISADDVPRAVAFYKKAFGWAIEKWEGPVEYWLVGTGKEGEPGIDGGLGKRSDPRETTVNTIGVASLDEAIAKVQAAGGKVTRPRMPVPGVGWMAYCVDTEGNPFGLMQDDPNAR